MSNLGLAHAALGDARNAIKYHEQALIVTREIGDRRGESHALWNSALAQAKSEKKLVLLVLCHSFIDV